ncbi:ABC transporter permease subunit [Mycoplasmopsis columbinasalis]|nr:ABC transporter permease [Mycoplasmopsis columbinasalis]
MYKISQKFHKIKKKLFWSVPIFKFLNAIIITIVIVFLLFLILNGLFPYTVPEQQQIATSGLSGDLTIQSIIQKKHLDKPLFLRGLIHILGYFKGEFGTLSNLNSQIYGTNTVADTNIWNYFVEKNSLTYLIAFIALVISFFIGVSLGYFAAKKRDTSWDYILNFFAISFLNVSLIILIPALIQWLSGYGIQTDYVLNKPSSLILPTMCLVLITIAPLLQVTRSKTIQVFNTNFYNFSKSLGLNNSFLFWKIVIPNVLIDILSLAPFLLMGLFSSSIFLEFYFRMPGTWSYFYAVIINYENSFTCFFVFFMGTIYSLNVTFNEIVKVILDPRQKGRANE